MTAPVNGQKKGFRSLLVYFLIMAISLIIIFIMWASFGYIGPQFSIDVLEKQQETLREHYGLAPLTKSDDPALAQIPPSLREIQLKNNSNIDDVP